MSTPLELPAPPLLLYESMHLANAVDLSINPAYIMVCPLHTSSTYPPTGAARLPRTVAAHGRTHGHLPPQLRGHGVGDVGLRRGRCGGPRGTAAAPLVCARATSMCARLVHVHVLVLK